MSASAWPGAGMVEVGKALAPAPQIMPPADGFGGFLVRRPPISPLDMFAGSAVMADAQAEMAGERKPKRRERRRRARILLEHAEGRAALYGPQGRGSEWPQ